jgi:sugar phosphate isomerase/epimerase
MPPIAIQLYSLRAQLAENYESILRRVADMGYVGVELAGMYGASPEFAARLLRELDLQVTSLHAPLPLLDNLSQTVDIANTFGVKRVVCAWYPPERFATLDDVRAVGDELNRANEFLRAQNLELHYHNHWQECALLDGKLVYQHMLDFLEPNVGFEVDVYWAKTAGVEPAAMIRELGKRAPLLHIKDGPATMDGDMTAAGEGIIDLRAISDASRETAEWWIVELDRCATDMLEAVEKSYTYLTQNGLAHGK